MLDAYRTHQTLDALEARLDDEAGQVMQELGLFLESEPANERALFLLGRSQALCGDAGAAVQSLQDLLQRNAAHVGAKVELAKLRHAEGDAAAAVALLQQATADAPQLVDNWRLLADYLERDGQRAAAAEAQRQHDMIKAFNGNLEAAEAAFAKGDLQTSDQMCRRLLEHVPGEIRTLRILAKIAMRFRYFESAVSILERCLESRPGDAQLRLDHARALLSGGRYREALVQCDRVTELAPETLDIYEVQAEALYNLGQYEDAMAIYRELSGIGDRRALSLVHLGKVATTVGETEAAVAYFRDALKEVPAPCQAYWELANLKTYRFADDEIAAMEHLLEVGKIAAMDAVLLRFALGRACEDEGRYADSFKHIEAANAAYAKRNPPRYESRNDALKSFFTKEYFAGTAGAGSDSKEPIFIVGMPRSGSTLVEQILSAHSEVDATAELTEIISIARELDGKGAVGRDQGQYPGVLASLNAEQVQDFAQRYLDFVQPLRAGGEFFIDKTPGNFHHVGLIKTLFPKAKIIDIRRNPMAAGWSLYKHFFADSFLFSYDLDTIGRYFNDYLDLMDHWHAVLPGHVLTLRYEDLVNDLAGSLDALLRYCSLPFEQACLDFHENRRAVATPSSEQVRSPLYDRALEHWKNYDAFLEPLRRVLGERETATGA